MWFFLFIFFFKWSSWLFCCLHLAGPKVYKVCFQERQCLTPALLSLRVGLHVIMTITPVFYIQGQPIFTFMNVIWSDEAICLTCLLKTHVLFAHRGGHLCCYVWLANWFHVLWFHLVHVYSQIRFNYVFHATIGIQARSQHIIYHKWCSSNQVKDVSCVSHGEANAYVCVKYLS